MADDNIPPDPPKTSMVPSGSTQLTLLGGAAAAVTMAILDKAFNIHFDAGVESAMAVLFAAALGYFPPSGRK